MTCCRRAEREMFALFQREVLLMDTIRQIVDLARQAIAAPDRLTRIRLVLQIVYLAAKAGIDLSALFGPAQPLALAGAKAAGPVGVADATEAVKALEAAAGESAPEGVATAAPGTVGGLLPPIGALVVRVIVELIRLL